jgi:hypothetical protein
LGTCFNKFRHKYRGGKPNTKSTRNCYGPLYNSGIQPVQREILAETVDGRQWPIQETDFEKYLERNGLLDWELDYADYEGEHIQQTGQMELEEYFDQDERYIKLDLQTYLESKYVVKNVTGYINTMVSRFKNVG